jgi:hypothetical protein
MNNEHELSILTRKLETYLSGKSKPVTEAIAKLERTGSLLDDYIKPVKDLGFVRHLADGNVRMNFEYLDEPQAGIMVPTKASLGLHQNAVSQIGEKFGVPPAYLRGLTFGTNWEKNLAVTIMQEHASNIAREKVLIRSVEGEARAVLSDRYRRLDSMRIFVAFLQGAQQIGSVLVDAHSGETKGFLEVINPKIVAFDTPLNGRNYACVGARIRNSDFGDGRLEVYLFALMVKCMNGLVGQTMLKEIHLGGRIPENIKISEDTYRKDTDAMAALVGDAMKQLASPDLTNGLITQIQDAAAVEVNLVKEVERLPKLGLTKTEAESVGKVLMENNPDNGLQGGATLWKLVNGLTAVARESKPERKRELEEIAGAMLVK